MIITSLLTGEKYFWVRIPRTGTHSYNKIFFPDLNTENSRLYHSHISVNTFPVPCLNPVKYTKAFTVVRHPKSRFISGLRHYWQGVLNKDKLSTVTYTSQNFIKMCGFCGEIHENTLPDFTIENYNGLDFLENEKIFYEFCYDNFQKNCNTTGSIQDIFKTTHLPAPAVFFQTQVFWSYNPKTLFFRHENIQEFNGWIESTLGYSTAKVEKEFNTSKQYQLNIDTTTEKFDKLVRYLFHDDYKVFGY